MNPNSLPKLCVAEFNGMFALIFIAWGDIYKDRSRENLGLSGIALAFALTMAAMVSIIGSISSGHPNPWVTLGLLAGGITAGLMMPVNIPPGGPFKVANMNLVHTFGTTLAKHHWNIQSAHGEPIICGKLSS